MAPQTPHTTRAMRNSQEQKAHENEPSILDRVTVLVNHVARSEEYTSLRRTNIPHTEAFSTAVDTILNSPENGFNDRDAALLRTSGQLGVFMEAQDELNALKDRKSKVRRLSQKEMNRAKWLKHDYIIPFNHSLKSLINVLPSASMDDIVGALSLTYTAVFSRYDAFRPTEPKLPQDIISQSEATYQIAQAMNGIRHEIAAESMLSAANIEYSYDISVEEDASGIDIVAYIDGKREPIDIKSSPFGESRAIDKNNGSRAIWTGLGQEDFRGMKGDKTNALSIPFEVAQDHADDFVDRIRSTVARAEAHKAAVARSMARSIRH